jgi:hypothetical protein
LVTTLRQRAAEPGWSSEASITDEYFGQLYDLFEQPNRQVLLFAPKY